jgi:hypothetical protein
MLAEHFQLFSILSIIESGQIRQSKNGLYMHLEISEQIAGV